MGLEFLPICDVLFNVVSLASYFCDVVFDVIAVYSFYIAGHTVWFWISLVSIVCSLTTCQVLSGAWLLSEDTTTSNYSKRKLSIISALHVTGCGMVWRYSQLFAPIHLDQVKREMRNLCVLRMIHGFVESMPLLLIQTYIAFKSPASMLEVNVISMALSLFNVCWALASFTKNIRSHNVHRLVLTWIGVIFQFMWRLGTVTSRVLVLVLYSLAFNYWVFLVVILHWITMLLWVLSRYTTLQNERLTVKNKVLLSICVSFVHVFCYLNLEEQNTKLKIITFYTIMLVENVLLITLWTLGTTEDQWIPYNRDRIYIAVFVSFAVGILFMIIYYKFFHVRKLSATLSYSPSDSTQNKIKQSNLRGALRSNGPLGSRQDPAVTVFNCALNPALRKKKKMATRSVPLPGVDTASNMVSTPFWKEPLPDPGSTPGPHEVRTQGDGFSYSRTTSVDDIRQKLQEKKEKQLEELRRIEQDIAEGRREKPSLPVPANRPVPVKKYPPMLNLAEAGYDAPQSGHSTWEHNTWDQHLPPASSLPPDQEWRPNPGGSYIGVSQPDPPTPVPVPASAGNFSGIRPNGYTGGYPGQPGSFPSLPNDYPGQASDFSSPPGSYPGPAGSYPGPQNSYPGPPGSYPGPLGGSAPLPQTSQHQDSKFMMRSYNPAGPLSSSTPVHSTPVHSTLIHKRIDTSQHFSTSPLQHSNKFQFDRPDDYNSSVSPEQYPYLNPAPHQSGAPSHPQRAGGDYNHQNYEERPLYKDPSSQVYMGPSVQDNQGPTGHRGQISNQGHNFQYPDSSGDHGDIDSCDDKQSPSHHSHPPHQLSYHPQHHPPHHRQHPHNNNQPTNSLEFRSERLPLPLPRNRVVIGGPGSAPGSAPGPAPGYDHETPL